MGWIRIGGEGDTDGAHTYSQACCWRNALATLCLLTCGASSEASATLFSASGPCSLTVTTDSSPVTVTQTCISGSTGETYQGTAKSSQGHPGAFITTTGGSTIKSALRKFVGLLHNRRHLQPHRRLDLTNDRRFSQSQTRRFALRRN